jgi:hypothetical protein
MPTTPKLSFDTLSDPNPPTPGAGERAAVNARAGTLARRRRFAQGAGALACTAVIGLGVVAPRLVERYRQGRSGVGAATGHEGQRADGGAGRGGADGRATG